MSDVLAARLLMGLSLAFHILFAAAGIALPLFMVIAEWRYRRTGDPVYLALAKTWSKSAAVLFAVGAVGGTVLSFELGLLWPRFMAFSGSIIGVPFALEGFAFFTEAIFLGIYLYGWERVSPRLHLAAGAVVAVAGAISGVLVLAAVAWMQTPAGFGTFNSQPVDIQPFTAMANPAWPHITLHMLLAAYQSVAAAMLGIHGFMLLRDRANLFHRKAFAFALTATLITGLLQPLAGDFSAKQVGALQPAKLAALEGQFRTEQGAPLRIGGIPDPDAGVTRLAIEIPGLLSWLAYGDPNATVRGLEEWPRDDWPPVVLVHLAFQVMVGSAFVMLGVAALGVLLAWRRKRLPDSRWFLWLAVAAAPLGFVALETGWIVTEVGRQPWIIYEVMRTVDAVTPVPNLGVPLVVFAAIYVLLGVITAWVLTYQIARSPRMPLSSEGSKGS
jgi:cytochrome d ubiquinol oxidase subunit I